MKTYPEVVYVAEGPAFNGRRTMDGGFRLEYKSLPTTEEEPFLLTRRLKPEVDRTVIEDDGEIQ